MLSLVKPPSVNDPEKPTDEINTSDSDNESKGDDAAERESLLDSEDRQLDALRRGIPCCVCKQENVGGCYLCDMCDTVICPLRTDGLGHFVHISWESEHDVRQVHRKRRKSAWHGGCHYRVDPVLGIEPKNSCSASCANLRLDARWQASHMYMNVDSVHLPSRRVTSSTPCTVADSITAVKKSLEGTHYIVKPHDWCRHGKSPSLFLQRSAEMVLEYDPENPYYHVQVANLEKERLKAKACTTSLAM